MCYKTLVRCDASLHDVHSPHLSHCGVQITLNLAAADVPAFELASANILHSIAHEHLFVRTLDVRTVQLVTNHCNMTAVAPLSNDSPI